MKSPMLLIAALIAMNAMGTACSDTNDSAGSSVADSAGAGNAETNVAEGWIIGVRDGFVAEQCAATMAAIPGITITNVLDLTGIIIIDDTSDMALAQVRGLACVLFVEKNTEVGTMPVPGDDLGRGWIVTIRDGFPASQCVARASSIPGISVLEVMDTLGVFTIDDASPLALDRLSREPCVLAVEKNQLISL